MKTTLLPETDTLFNTLKKVQERYKKLLKASTFVLSILMANIFPNVMFGQTSTLYYASPGDLLNVKAPPSFADFYSVNAQDSVPGDIKFNQDGTVMYVIGTSGITGYVLTTAFDITSVTTPTTTSVAGTSGLAFSYDGSMMFTVESGAQDSINQYTLGTPFSVGTRTQVFPSLDVSSETSTPYGLAFSNDGTQMFVSGQADGFIYTYDLSASWDITTATYDSINSLDVSADVANPQGIAFNADGTKFYIMDSGDDEIEQYALDGTPYDISTNNREGAFNILSQETNGTGIAFDPTWTQLFIVGGGQDRVHSYDLNTILFEEVFGNNGEVNGSMILYLKGFEKFTNAGSTMPDSNYTISNLPAGLIPQLDVDFDSLYATLTLIDSATSNDVADNISSLTFTFTDDAFIFGDTSVVDNSTSFSTGFGIEFNEGFAPDQLIAYQSGTSQITLEWIDTAINETGFEIRAASDFGFSQNLTILDTIGANSTTYIHNTVADTGIFYLVRALSDIGVLDSAIAFASTKNHPGYALDFDGVDDNITFTSSPILPDPVTIEAWIKLDNLTGSKKIVSWYSGPLNFFEFGINGNNLQAYAEASNGTPESDTEVLDSLQWTHVAITISSNSYQFYVNGVATSSTSTTDAVSGIGGFEIGSTNGSSLFEGEMDELKIWDYIKSDFSDRSTAPNGDETGLVAYFPFDENTPDSVAMDRSVFTNNGTINGGPVYVTSGAIPLTITSVVPAPSTIDIPINSSIVFTFSDSVENTSLDTTNLVVVGNQSGKIEGAFSGGGTSTITFNPTNDFFPNEIVTIIVTDRVKSTSGISALPYSSSFRAAGGAFEGAFVKKVTALDGVVDAEASWGDYDNDGDLDLVIGGWDFEYSLTISKIYNNNAGTFTDIGDTLEPVYNPFFSWGDFDNDGDLDLFLTGFGNSNPVAILYDNNAGTFSANGNSFTGVYYSSSEWGDFDNDGDLDLAVQGLITGGSTASTILYRNDSGTFVDHGAGLTGLNKGSITWGDYDNDGDLDLFTSGYTSSSASREAIIYENSGGTFTDIGAGLTGKSDGRAEWGDYDNDGDLDLVISGADSATNAPIIYRNDAGSFVDISAGLLDNAEGGISWGDYDGDADLDLIINGSGETNSPTTTLYTNNAGTFTESEIRLDDFLYGSADWGDYDNDGDIDLLLTGTDYTFNGGRIALFENTIAPPTIYNATDVTITGFTANYVAPSGAVDILLDVSTDSLFGSFLPEGQNLSLGLSGSATIAVSLAPGTRYFYRAKTDFGGSESVYYLSKAFMVQPGNVLSFTGNQYVDISDDEVNYDPAGDFTIEFWFNTTVSGNVILFEKDNDNTQYSVQQFSGDVIGLNVNGGTMQTVGSYNDGNWHHAALVYRGPGDGAIYVDGVDDTDTTSITLGTPTYGFATLTIGDRRFGGSFNMEGSMDELRLWEDERTLTEIQDNQNKTLIGNEQGLLAYYRFDQTSGTTLHDYSNNYLIPGDLTNMSGTEWSQSGAASAPTDFFVQEISTSQIDLTWTDNLENELDYVVQRANSFDFSSGVTQFFVGINDTSFTDNSVLADNNYYYRVVSVLSNGDSTATTAIKAANTIDLPGNALDFDGSNDYVRVRSNPDIEVANYTFEVWAKMDSLPIIPDDGYVFFQKGQLDTQPSGYLFGYILDGDSTTYRIYLAHADTSGTPNFFAPAYTVTPGEWTHFAGTYDGSELEIFVNGTSIGTTPLSNDPGYLPFEEDLKIGVSETSGPTLGSYMNGGLDEIRIWDYVRDSVQINSTLYSTLDGNEAGLRAYYKFDQNQDSLFWDRSTNTSDGALTNFALSGNTSNWVPSGAISPATPPTAPNNVYVFATGDTLNINWSDQSSNEAGFKILRADSAVGPYNQVAVVTDTFYHDAVGFNKGYFYRVAAYLGGAADTSVVEFGSTYDYPGFALDFDGTGDYVEVAYDSILNTANFTAEAWVKVTGGTGNYRSVIVSRGTTRGYFIYANNSNVWEFTAGDTSSWTSVFGPAITLNEWTHVAITINGTTLTGYVNGSSVGTNTLNYVVNPGNPLRIGATSDASPTFFMDGQIDEVRIWNFAKDSTQIQSEQYTSLFGNESNLIAYYSFDEGAGDTSIDKSVNPYNGGVYGNPAFILSDAGLPGTPSNLLATVNSFNQPQLDWDDVSGATGYVVERSQDDLNSFVQVATPSISSYTDSSTFDGSIYYYRARSDDGNAISLPSGIAIADIKGPGYALDFNGIDQYIDIPDTAVLDISGALTLSAWIYADQWPQGGIEGVVAKWSEFSERSYGIFVDPEGKPVMAVSDNGDSVTAILSRTSLTPGTWNHIAGTYTPSTDIRIYINGRLTDIETSGIPASLNNGSEPLQIGALNPTTIDPSAVWSGKIDEVSVWNSALSQDSIRDIIHTKLDTAYSDLVAYYNFDHLSDSVLVDLKSGFNGAMKNFSDSSWEKSGAFVPFALQATEISSVRFDANWFEVPDATGYRVEWADNAAFSGSTMEAFGSGNFATLASFDTSGVDKYYYRVAFEDGGYVSPYSDTVSFMVTPGYALDFDGSDYVIIADEPKLNFGTGDFTIEFWMQTSTTNKAIISKRVSAGAWWRVALSGGQIYFELGGSGAITSTNSFNDGQWHHVVTKRQSGTAYIYVDGVQEASGTLSGSTDNSDQVEIGSWQNGVQARFIGTLDEIRLWNTFREENEIEKDRYNTLSGAEANLVAYYRFDELTGTDTLYDQSISGYNGELVSLDTTLANYISSTAFNNETYEVTNTSDSSAGSLRAAITAANGSGADNITITFNLPSVADTIYLSSQINVTRRMVIDGSTQPGWDITANQLVNVFGASGTGLNVTGDSIEIYGLHMEGFAQAIYAFGGDYIQVGDDVRGNILANNTDGIRFDASYGQVYGNYIGTDYTGSQDWGNSSFGISLRSASTNNIIGSTDSLQSNVIAYNNSGVYSIGSGTVNNTITGNYIYCNTNLGIDHTASSDMDSVLAPVITSAGITQISGTVENWVDTLSQVHIYLSDTICTTNQGFAYMGIADVEDLGGGNMGFNFNGSFLPGEEFVATLTASTLGTSEFSSTATITFSELTLRFEGNDIAKDSTINTGIVLLTSQTDTLDYYLVSTGTDTLIVSNVGLFTGDFTNFSLIENTPDTLAPGDSSLFQLALTPDTSGVQSMTLRILSNDTLLGPNFDFTSEYLGYPNNAPGTALEFDGIDDGVLILEDSLVDFQTGDDFSIGVWFKTPSNTNDMALVAKHQSGSTNGYFMTVNPSGGSGYCNQPGGMNFYVSSAAPQDVCSDAIINDDKWHYAVGTYNSGTNTSRLYIDGILQSDLGSTDGTLDNNDLDLGIGYMPGLGSYFDGQIDEVSIWNKDLDSATIQSYLLQTIDQSHPDFDSLVAYYRFDIGQDSIAYDLANGNDGQLVGSMTNGDWVLSEALSLPPLITTLNPSTSSTDIPINTIFEVVFDQPVDNTSGTGFAYLVDRGDSSIVDSIASASLSITGDTLFIPFSGLSYLKEYAITLDSGLVTDTIGFSAFDGILDTATWFFTTLDTPNFALDFGGSSEYVQLPAIPLDPSLTNFTVELWAKANALTGAQNLFVQEDGAGTGRGYLYFTEQNLASNLGGSGIVGSTSLSTDTWYHVAVSYNGTNVTTYINGVQEAQSAVTPESANGQFRLGISKTSASPLGGQIDEVKVWDRAKSEKELQAYFGNYSTGTEYGLLAYYDMQITEVDTLYDKVGLYNGVLTNMDPGSVWFEGNQGVDKDPIPAVRSLEPLAESLGVPLFQQLAITFTEAVNGIGDSLYLISTADSVIREGVGSTTINGQGTDSLDFPLNNLDYATAYAITIDSGAFENIGGSQVFPGIQDTLFWTFMTEDHPDSFPPTISFSTIESDPTNTTPFDVDIIFSEIVGGFDTSDLVVSNALVNSMSTGDSTTFTAQLSPITDGLVTLDIGVGVAIDTANNLNDSSAQFAISYDATNPTVFISSGEPDPTNSSPFSILIIFDETVGGFADTDITVGNGTAGNLVTGDSIAFTADITPSGDGLVTVDVFASIATDSAGNNNDAATQFAITYDGSNPTTLITSGEPDPTNSSPFSVAIVFNEAVSGFADADITIGNGTAGNLATGDSTTFTADITPSGDGLVTVDVFAGIATDSAGNVNDAATQFAITYDGSNPTTLITSGEPDPTNSSPFSVAVIFNEAVSGFADTDITVGNGTAGNLVTGDSIAFTADITPSGDGLVTVDVFAGIATDSAGNNNDAATQFAITYDITAPATPSIDSVLTNQTNPIITGFFESGSMLDVEIVGYNTYVLGTDPQLTDLGGGSWQLDLTGESVLPENTFDVNLTSTDDASNQVVENVFNAIETDYTFPDVAIDRDPGQADPTNASPVQYEVVFSEPIQTGTFGNGDIDFTGTSTSGSPSASVVEISPFDGTTFQVDVNGISGTGFVVANINTSSIFDLAGNGNNASTSTDNAVGFDDVVPVPTADPLTTSDTQPALSGTIDDITSSLTVEVDGQSNPATVNGDNTWDLAQGVLTPLAVGNYNVRLIAIDSLTNTSDTTFVGALVIEETVSDITITTLPVAGGSVLQGSSNVVVYAFSVDVQTADAVEEVFLVQFGDSTVVPGLFVNNSFNLYRNESTEDFATAGLLQSGVDFGVAGFADGIVFFQSDTIPVGSTWYYYVSADIEPTATVGANFQVLTDTVESFGFLDPKNKIDGGLSAGSVFTVFDGNYALDFDGIDDYVSFNDAILPASNSTRTIEAWVNTTHTGSNAYFFSYGTFATGQLIALGISSVTNGALLTVDGNVLQGNTVINDGAWHHVAFSFDGTTYSLYVDGVFDNSRAMTTNTAIAGNGRMGILVNNTIPINASLDELRVWNFAKNVTQVTGQKDISLSGSETGLVAYWDFQDGPGTTTVTDVTGGGSVGTLVSMDPATDWITGPGLLSLPGAPTNLITSEVSQTQIDLSWMDNSTNEFDFAIYRSTGNNSSYVLIDSVGIDVTTYSDNSVVADTNYFYYVVARNAGGESAPSNEKAAATFIPPGNALTFDGVDDHVLVPNHSSFDFGDDDYTIELWFSTLSSNFGKLVAKHACGTNNGYYVEVSDNGTIVFRGGGGLLESNTIVNDGNWHHLAITNNATPNTLTIYLDGILDNSGAGADGNVSNGEPLGIGAWSTVACGGAGSLPFEGQIEEVRIWNVVRTEAEIQSKLNTVLIGNEIGLVAYYKLDQTDPAIAILPDRSSNQNVGTLENFGGAANWTPSGALDSAATSSNITLTTLFIPGDLVQQGDTSVLVYGFSAAVTDNDAIEEGIFLTLNDTTVKDLVVDNSIKLWRKINADDFATSTLEQSGGDFSLDTIGFVLNDTIPAGDTWYYYITFDIEPNALSGSTFIVGTPGVDNFGYADPKTKNDGGLISGSVYTVFDGNYGLEFDGSSEYVAITDAPEFDIDTDWTIEAWVKTTGGGQQGIVSQFGSDGYSFFKIGGTLYFQYYRSTGGYENGGGSMAAAGSFADNTWHHVAVSQQGNVGKLYVDGMKIHEISTMVQVAESATDIHLGHHPNVGAYVGSMDEVRFWDYARTESEMLDHYNVKLTGQEAGLIAYYKLNEGIGETTFDGAGNNNGTLTNMDGNTDWVIGPSLVGEPYLSIRSLDPLPGATGVGRDQALSMAFTEGVQSGAGYVYLLAKADTAVQDSIASNAVIGLGTDSISFTFGTRDYDLEYAILVDSGAFENLAGDKAYRGIDDINAWSFTSETNPDVISPTVMLSTAEPDPTNTSPFEVTIVFSELVTGFDAGDLTIGNGTAGNLNTADSITFTVDITPTADGLVSIDLGAGAVDDPSGNPNEAATSISLTYDGTAPTITVDVDSTTDTTPALSGTVDDATAVINLTVDGGGYTATNVGDGTWSLADNVITPALTDGVYDVIVTATDAVGNVGVDGTSDELTIDNTAPTVTVAALQTNDNTPALSGTVDDVTATISLTIAGEVYAPTNAGDGTWSLADNVITPVLGDGIYDVGVTATDGIGNVGTDGTTDELLIDTTAPTVTVNQKVTADPTPSLSGTVDDTGATVTVNVGGQEVSATVTDNTWTVADNVLEPLSDDTYDVMATATDALGNVGVDGTTDELIVNTTNPIITVDFLTTNDRTPPLSGLISDPDASIEITVDGDSYTATNVGDGTWTLSDNMISPQLQERSYDVVALATAVSTATGTDNTTLELTIDITAPQVTIEKKETFDVTPSLSGTVSDPEAIVRVSVDGETYTATTDGTDWTLADNLIQPLAVGLYSVTVTATDVAGNVGTDPSSAELRILPSPVVALEPTDLGNFGFTAQWEAVASGEEVTYSFDVSAKPYFSSFVAGYEKVLTSETNREVTGLIYGRVYYYRVRVRYPSGDFSEYSNVIQVKTLVDPNTVSDSLAMLAIYQATGGEDWLNKTNYDVPNNKDLRLEDLHGVEMSGTRITAIDLSNNNLQGALPDLTDGLENVTTVDLSGNAINDIGLLTGLTSLTSLDVRNNKLEFGELEELEAASVPAQYDPQGKVLEVLPTLQQIGESYTVAREVSGTGNVYSWKRDGTDIAEEASSFTVEINTFDDEGAYHALVTNGQFPGLTLETEPVILKISSLKRDSTALVNIYEALNGANWTNSGNWLSGNLSQWNGVTISNQRVTGLNLGARNVRGDMPIDITDIRGLQTVNLSNNDIFSIPDMTVLTNLTSLNVSRNALDFEDLLPNAGITGINYANQDEIGEETYGEFDKGTTVRLRLDTREVTGNQYVWKRNGSAITNSNSRVYDIAHIDYETMGVYITEVTNPGVPGLTLQSREKTALGVADIKFTPTYVDIDNEKGILDEGRSYLLKVNAPGQPYDTLYDTEVTAEPIFYERVILGDYLFSIRTDSLILRTTDDGRTDSIRLLPSFYIRIGDAVGGTYLWEEADILMLRDFIDDSMQMAQRPRPLPVIPDPNTIGLGVETDFQDEATTRGRYEARRRVQRAGCSLSRRRGSGRSEDNHDWELYIYKETDDNGRVQFENLPPNTYRLNIQYPGIPMDSTSFIEFIVGEDGEQETLELEATITEAGIDVALIEKLSVFRGFMRGVTIYPNPANKYLTITYTKLLVDDIHVRLMDLTGSVVMDLEIERGYYKEFELDVSNVRPGIYLLNFYDPDLPINTSGTYKVIVTH